MADEKRYHCSRCGLSLDFDEAEMKAHYKEGVPNCPSCARAMAPSEEPAAAKS